MYYSFLHFSFILLLQWWNLPDDGLGYSEEIIADGGTRGSAEHTHVNRFLD